MDCVLLSGMLETDKYTAGCGLATILYKWTVLTITVSANTMTCFVGTFLLNNSEDMGSNLTWVRSEIKCVFST